MRHPNDSPRIWKVGFEPGMLRAVARDANMEIAADELQTAGTPAKLILSSNETTLTRHWDDVAVITVKVVDKNGVVVARAANEINFALNGGEIAAVDNGDTASHEAFKASVRSAYQGRAIAIIRAGTAKGNIVVTAKSEGLTSGELRINVQ